MILTCFKSYDIRGRLGVELNEGVAAIIGRAFGQTLGARRVVLGRDCRASSAALAGAVAAGLREAGVDVLDLGLCGTEEVYFATAHLGADGGIEVTASHNPMDYNGMKLVKSGAAPLEPALLAKVRALAESGKFAPARPGQITAVDTRAAYVDRILSFVELSALRPLKILVNPGNGTAGPTFDALAAEIAARGAPLTFQRINHTPDGTFPNGIPNPMLPENQPATAAAVRAHGADFAVAWDGDFDRCFLFDHQGSFVPGEYVVGLLAQVFLAKEPGATIIHDPRIIWNTQALVARAGGHAVMAPTGHAFLKAKMREVGAVYGGEMSAHHYFRDFMACDSGMIPWLLVAEQLSRSGQSLRDILAARRAEFPSSGEVNFRVLDVQSTVTRIEASYAPQAQGRSDIDGLSLDFGDWRFSLRASNTEPLLRLNVESHGNPGLVQARVDEISALIGGASAH